MPIIKKLFSINSIYNDITALVLRLCLGVLFVYYGFNKLSAYHTILPQFGDIIGIGSKLSLNLVIFAELFCGFFVAIGLFTRLSIIPVFITMAVAYFIAHAGSTLQDKTLPLVFMVLSVAIFFLGSGKYSVDAFIFRRRLE